MVVIAAASGEIDKAFGGQILGQQRLMRLGIDMVAPAGARCSPIDARQADKGGGIDHAALKHQPVIGGDDQIAYTPTKSRPVPRVIMTWFSVAEPPSKETGGLQGILRRVRRSYCV